MATLEGVQDLTLALLNGVTQAWVELEYHRREHGETAQTPIGVIRAAERLDSREVRSFEVAYVHGLWHLDFHHGSRNVLTAQGHRYAYLAPRSAGPPRGLRG